MGRNRTGPPCSVGRPTAHTPGGQPARRQRYRQRQTTDARKQNNTGPLGGPVITRAHSFPRAAEFRAEPRNLAVAAEFRVFVEFHGILRKHENSEATAKFRKAVLIVTLSPFGQLHRPVDFSEAFFTFSLLT